MKSTIHFKFLLLLITTMVIPLAYSSVSFADGKYPLNNFPIGSNPFQKPLYNPTCTTGGPSANILWENCLGGSDSDIANSIKRTLDGGYIIAGSTKSTNGDVSGNHGKKDCWVVKLNKNGILSWATCIGGSDDDFAYGVDLTANGYVIAGSTKSNDGNVSGNHGSKDVLVARLNASGGIQWVKCYGGTKSDGAYDIKTTADGGFVVAGFTTSTDGDLTSHKGTFLGNSEAYWVFKIDASGNLAVDPFSQNESYVYGGQYVDFARSVCLTTDGGCITTGYSRTAEGDPCDENLYSIKFDAYLNSSWTTNLGAWNGEGATVIKQTSDLGYITSGISHSFNCAIHNAGEPCNGDTAFQDPYPHTYSCDPVDPSFHGSLHEMWVTKTTQTGTLDATFGTLNPGPARTGERCYGGTGNEEGTDLLQTCEGGYLLVGQSSSSNGDVTCNNGGPHDAWVVKTDAAGNITWQQSFGGTGDEEANSVAQAVDGSFVFAGYTSSTDGDAATANDVDLSGNHGLNDLWVVKFEPINPITCTPPVPLTPGVYLCTSTLSWTGHTCDATYNLQYKLTSAATWTTVPNAANPTVLSNLSAGTYKWRVQAQCSASNTTSMIAGLNFVINDPCNNRSTIITADNPSNVFFEVYPNPAHDNITLSLKQAAPETQEIIINVINATGIPVLQTHGDMIEGKLLQQLTLPHLADGVYDVQVHFDNHVYEQLFVVQ